MSAAGPRRAAGAPGRETGWARPHRHVRGRRPHPLQRPAGHALRPGGAARRIRRCVRTRGVPSWSRMPSAFSCPEVLRSRRLLNVAFGSTDVFTDDSGVDGRPSRQCRPEVVTGQLLLGSTLAGAHRPRRAGRLHGQACTRARAAETLGEPVAGGDLVGSMEPHRPLTEGAQRGQERALAAVVRPHERMQRRQRQRAILHASIVLNPQPFDMGTIHRAIIPHGGRAGQNGGDRTARCAWRSPRHCPAISLRFARLHGASDLDGSGPGARGYSADSENTNAPAPAEAHR